MTLARACNAPYATGQVNVTNTHVRLLRYGGGSVAVGSLKLLYGTILGVATGRDGRMWVMWGTANGNRSGQIAVTRSNLAVTKFEPVQVFNTKAFFLWRLFGDGRLGPLDLFVREQPTGPHGVNGIYYARIMPELSARVSVAALGGGRFRLRVKVTDAGDAAGGATVSANGHRKSTNAKGNARVTVTGSAGDRVVVTITAPGYRTLKERVRL